MNKIYSVHDHWTDINKKNDVDIMSIDGVITGIKVNGEDYGGGGSSDFSTAEVTFANSSSLRFNFNIPYTVDEGGKSASFSRISHTDIGSGTTINAILYKGNCFATLAALGADDPSIEVSGNIQDLGHNTYLITGDCTIAIS